MEEVCYKRIPHTYITRHDDVIIGYDILLLFVFTVDSMTDKINELEDTVSDLMKRAGVTPEEVARMQEERRRAKAAASQAPEAK